MAVSIHHDTWQFISTAGTVRPSRTQLHCKWCTPWCNTQTLPRHSLLSQCRAGSQYMYEFHLRPREKYGFPCVDFYMTQKRSTALCAQLYTKFHPNLTINLCRTEKNSLISLSKARLSMNQRVKLKNDQQHYVGAYSYKNHACLTALCYELLYQLSWDCGKQFSQWYQVTDGNGCGLHLKCSSHYFIKNA